MYDKLKYYTHELPKRGKLGISKGQIMAQAIVDFKTQKAATYANIWKFLPDIVHQNLAVFEAVNNEAYNVMMQARIAAREV